MADIETDKEKELVKELVVNVTPSEVHIALLENHRLTELSKESCTGHEYSVGDVYLGKVKRVMPSLNAAFVDIGDEKEAFIHYLDLGLHFDSFDQFVRTTNRNTDPAQVYSNITIGPKLEKEGRIEKILTPGQMVIVQITKEPISTKGSRLTAEISIAGRNIVLMPFAEKVNVSQKISAKEEKRRLETLVESILPKNYGAIIRTAAEGKNAAVLVAELKGLIQKWEDSWKKLCQSKGVQQLLTEYSKTTTILRDLLNDSFTNIYVDSKKEYDDIRKYIATISPEQEKIVRLYEGKEPVFDHFEVTRQIKSSFGKVVPIRQGAYLVIESTEALNVVDVNSGTRGKNKEQEENTYDVNRYAAEEIARQMRLRDMGGIIIVDFIDMDLQEHRTGLFKYMQELMQNDRAKHNVLPLTKFGLMQITRQRVRPITEINTLEVCPVCHGTGKISSSLLIDEQIERKLSDLVTEGGHKSLLLKTNPILGAYLSRGMFGSSYISKWKRKYKCKIKLLETSDFTVLQNEFYTESGEKLD